MTIEILLMGVDMTFLITLDLLEDPNVWTADTGASCDSTGSLIAVHNRRVPKKDDCITLVDGGKKGTTMIGDISGTMCSKNGVTINDCKMIDIKYYKENKYNLFSIARCLKNGWSLHGNKKKIWITKGQQKVVFDIWIPTKEGLIFAVYINMKHNIKTANAGTEVQRDFFLNINKAHDLLVHADEVRCRAAAKNLGWVITRGKLNLCESCAVSKSGQTNVPKKSEHEKSTESG
eukprot:15367177-Ditylum_brightwellii.AAC.3